MTLRGHLAADLPSSRLSHLRLAGSHAHKQLHARLFHTTQTQRGYQPMTADAIPSRSPLLGKDGHSSRENALLTYQKDSFVQNNLPRMTSQLPSDPLPDTVGCVYKINLLYKKYPPVSDGSDRWWPPCPGC